MPNTIVTRPPFVKRGQPTWIPTKSLSLGSFTGSGGVLIGGGATASFTHGPQVPSDIVIEWDLDNDGDFSAVVEDITSYVLAIETTTGRDWPSLLTGKAGPGRLRATLNNADDRFSYFNTSSPLTTAPFSLKTGRKLRVRTSTASNPDPALLAKDRFGRADGALGTPEVGAAWSGPLANDFTIVSKTARPATEGSVHIGVIDVGSTAYYAQARLSEVGAGTNVVGLVYRYQDTTNYSLAVVDVSAALLKLIDVVAGAPSTVASEAVEIYDEITVGVLVSGASVTFYHEGVPVFSGTAIQTDETEVGIYASWGSGDVRPEVDDFYVWDGLPTQVEGILWTGDVSDLTMTVEAGPSKLAVLEGQGWLSRLATQKLTPMRSVQGKKTGILVGNVLGRTNLLHPPGSIDEGDITTGPVRLTEMDAIEAARQFEETEFGFLYESQEGPLTYDARSARAGSVSAVTFTDALGGQFGYTGIEPLDWRREVLNRVIAGVAAATPSGISLSTHNQTNLGLANSFDITMPATVTSGDLLLVAATATPSGDIFDWRVPDGWTAITDLPVTNTTTAPPVLFAKIADGTEDSTVLTFGIMEDTSGNGGAVAHIYRITGWFGSLDGIELSTMDAGSDPSVIFPRWNLDPSMFIAFRFGYSTNDTAGPSSVSGTTYPLGYGNGTSTVALPSFDADAAVQSAYRLAITEVENPAAFGGTFSGFHFTSSIVVAIRGFNGSPPVSSGVFTVQLDDLDSQDDHNSIRTHNEASDLFANTTDATTYAQLVLDTYADDRPLFRLTFAATKSGSYRYQAVKRRVGDRITLVATGNAGLGVSADFYIESISHEWSKGITQWRTTWELSPV